MGIRELLESDLTALLGLCERALPLDPFTLPLLARRVLDEALHRPELQLGAWEGERLIGAMLGGVRDGEDGPFAAVRLFAVEPGFRRRGVASGLLRGMEARVRTAGHRRLRVGNQAPVYFWPGVDVRYTPALCFLEKHGYERRGEMINMGVDLGSRDWDTAEREARLAVEGFAVHRLEPADREAFGGWLRRVWGPVWEREALGTYSNEPVSTWVATRDGRVCAFASYNATAFPNWFGPTGTEEELRGRGLGEVLLHRCMRDLRELGHSECEVGWVGPVAFYSKVADARISRVFWWYEREL